MTYKALRRVRVGVSALFAALLTWCVIDAQVQASMLGRMIMKVQLVPAIISASVAWVMVWIITTLTFGRIYCSSVCPLGTYQDACAHLGRKLSRKSSLRRYRYAPPMMPLRMVLPAIVGVCLLVGLTGVVEATDPSNLYRRTLLALMRPLSIGAGSLCLAIVGVGVVSMCSWSRGRILCNTLCPVGGLLALLSRQPVYRIDINTDKCVHCGKCEDVCKSQCVDLKDYVVDNSRCVRCFDCNAICPNDAIVIRKGRHTLSIPMMQRTATQMRHGKLEKSKKANLPN